MVDRSAVANLLRFLRGDQPVKLVSTAEPVKLASVSTNLVSIKQNKFSKEDLIQLKPTSIPPVTPSKLRNITNLIANNQISEAKSELETLKNTLDSLKNANLIDTKKLFLAEKEMKFVIFLLTQFEMEGELKKGFLKQLSNIILKIGLCDNLTLSGMIHCNLLNLKDEGKISTYLNDFSEYFETQNLRNAEAQKNQIIFVKSLKDLKQNTQTAYSPLLKSVFYFYEQIALNNVSSKESIVKVALKSKLEKQMMSHIYLAIKEIIRQIVENSMNVNQGNDLVEYILLVKPDVLKLTAEYPCKTPLKLGSIRELRQTVLKLVYSDLVAVSQSCSSGVPVDATYFCRSDLYIDTLIKAREEKISEIREKWLKTADKSAVYGEFKNIFARDELVRMALRLVEECRPVEALAVLQYCKNVDYGLISRIAKNAVEKHSKKGRTFIWKISVLEILAFVYGEHHKSEELKEIQLLLKRVSSHQLLKNHELRKHFKVANFFSLMQFLA